MGRYASLSRWKKKAHTRASEITPDPVMDFHRSPVWVIIRETGKSHSEERSDRPAPAQTQAEQLKTFLPLAYRPTPGLHPKRPKGGGQQEEKHKLQRHLSPRRRCHSSSPSPPLAMMPRSRRSSHQSGKPCHPRGTAPSSLCGWIGADGYLLFLRRTPKPPTAAYPSLCPGTYALLIF